MFAWLHKKQPAPTPFVEQVTLGEIVAWQGYLATLQIVAEQMHLPPHIEEVLGEYRTILDVEIQERCK